MPPTIDVRGAWHNPDALKYVVDHARGIAGRAMLVFGLFTLFQGAVHADAPLPDLAAIVKTCTIKNTNNPTMKDVLVYNAVENRGPVPKVDQSDALFIVYDAKRPENSLDPFQGSIIPPLAPGQVHVVQIGIITTVGKDQAVGVRGIVNMIRGPGTHQEISDGNRDNDVLSKFSFPCDDSVLRSKGYIPPSS